MIRNGHAGFGRGVSEKDHKAPRRGPTSADPTGEKARAVKVRYQGVYRGCGAYTQPRNGKGDAYAYCKARRPGAIKRRWTRERVIAEMCECRSRYGRLPSSYDWSRTHARRRVGDALERLADGVWPAASVSRACSAPGLWLVRRLGGRRGEVPTGPPPSVVSPLGSDSISLPKSRESTAKSEDRRGGEEELQQVELQGFPVGGADVAHNSGR